MGARDDAVAIIQAEQLPWLRVDDVRAARVVDALAASPGLLARLAIETGGLEDDGTWIVPNDPDDYLVHYEDEDRPDNAVSLYRLVTP